MKAIDAIRLRLRRLIFLEKSPEPGELVLNQRRVFTLPSKPGLVFLLLLIICFLTATNYNLNLGFGMTYLLAGVAVVNTLFTYRNLAYLKLNARDGAAVFAGDPAEFQFHVKNAEQLERFAIHISFQHSPHLEQIIDLKRGEETLVKLSCMTTNRGPLACPRVQLQTWFPLGLLRAWSTWLPATQVLVYPAPELNSPPLPFIGELGEKGNANTGHEDYAGVRSYQAGDPLKHLSWKHIARVDLEAGGNLISKQFDGASFGALLIDFASLPNQLPIEQKLSRMTSWILEADRLGLPYEFKLAALHLPSASGENHRHACLSALANYGYSRIENGSAQ